jgi:hypothetical protein
MTTPTNRHIGGLIDVESNERLKSREHGDPIPELLYQSIGPPSVLEVVYPVTQNSL